MDERILDDPGQESGLDIGQILLFGIGRFRYWVALFVILGGLGGLAVALMQPNQFSSEVKVLVRPGIRMLRSPESTLDANQTAMGSGTAVVDEIHLLSNPDLPMRVVQKVGVALVLRPYDPRTRDTDKTSWLMRNLHELQVYWASRSSLSVGDETALAQQAAAETITSNLRLVSARGTGVIAIYYAAHSPEIARTIADAFLEVALERHGEVFASEATLAMVTQEYENALERARLANMAFREHRDQCGIVDFEVQRGEAVRVIQQEKAAIDQDRIQLESIKGELELLDERLSGISSEVEDDHPAVVLPLANPEFAPLRQALLALQAQRRGLSGQFVEGSEHYRSEYDYLTDQIEETEGLLANTEEWLPLDAAGGTATNPVYAQTIAARLSREQQQRFLLSGLNSRKQSLKRHEAQLDDVMSCESVHRNHLAAIGRAEQNAGTLAAVYTRENALASIDQSASLMVIQDATLPTKKDGPERLEICLFGIALGVFAGVTFATLRQLADSKMRYPAEIETTLGIPVLGLIPESRGWRRLGRKLGHKLASDQKQTAPKPA